MAKKKVKIYAVLRGREGVINDMEVPNDNLEEAWSMFKKMYENQPNILNGSRITFQSQPYYYAKGGGIGATIEVVGKGDRGAFRKREYQGMTEKEVSDWWESRGYKPSKNKSESNLKPYTFYINKYAKGGGVGEKVWQVIYYGEKHLKQRGSSKGSYKTWVVANSREEAIEKVKSDDDEFAELKSAKPTTLDVERHKFAKGGEVFDENRQMVLNNNKQIRHHTEELPRAVKGNKHIPAWVVSKVGRSASDLSDVTHFLEGEAGTKYGRGGTTIEKDHEIETEEDGEAIVVEFIYTVSKENDGIGSYEFHGSRGYDSGTDYIVVEDIEWDKSSHTDRENEVIQKYLDKNFSSLAEDMSESLDPQDFGKGGTTKSWNYEIGGL